ncbi:hypothetical protein CEUSTIGMA_g487.t1 [Chlamydomonas eustigma]|uniref:Transcription factor CBF/NF-Y/archaeal histone domain-containing protein n=1 Tax=Chlamydomonas eustigma TaxID=1157962 RepID=A0A250WQA9_9CHLO|nr:hypothetical protein CEUSTIGMA_g487.t1 [Chlamydomonas eustigma]|eukprot:GAX73035.1 hypothetical protein CEUSTIGMA_g487.t1 [Chlamydomonas eustigma]
MDDEVSLPKATLQKLVKDFMPEDMRVAGDTVEMLVNCCTEFVQLLSSEANEVATREKKNTIQPEHVMTALKELGFTSFEAEVALAWEQHKEEAKTASSHKAALRKTGADQLGYTEAEQIAMQQQMFAAARARSLSSMEAPPPSYLPAAGSDVGVNRGVAPVVVQVPGSDQHLEEEEDAEDDINPE